MLIRLLIFFNHTSSLFFDLPESLVFDKASYFSSHELYAYAVEKSFEVEYLINYYLQGNGLVKSSNKKLLKIPKRIISGNHKN